ncbi:50S ribosomal protein L24 [Candidatus Pacearchaeota archaeon CG10_big_fil_rev_8_21_14_0_10_35_219]|nr:MAG: 50S ribosomal protein L24 [Candidatus Pacearchaeota archaeon CG1_02_35_32]PIO07455.1 MAG: 50S ribosomal protein L24 [Candidatus Pacearchaeota archaeon CG10_big_fil_rev_8_21_14_0_10_35_219]PIY81261.1 MAG: 50S ribosomal protein L24 [Candidatus Pacearchaeota archaeon CG_4_10_14_0_8_um_filter_35_169]PJB94419.1 MAG: 50S ribosomal protein L24 [Candidatus Pacearchaeota archaeon CG_4_9_14_0_8_um_filter_35_24]
MKSKFSTKWTASKQPRKQRKYKYNAPLHLRHRFLNAHLSLELRKKYGKRSFPVRKGDEVLVMRGKFKKKKAKITEVNLKKERIVLENVNREKKDGNKVAVYFHPSNLVIESLNLDDKERLKLLKEKPVEKKSGKHVEKEAKNEDKNKEKENVPNKIKS